MADEIRRVLDAIVQRWVVSNERRAIELDASAADSGAEIELDQQEAVRREIARAGDLAADFEHGLAFAWERTRTGAADIVLDDRDPEQNRIADALIRFLVSCDLAASRSVATDPNHYIYAIMIDWSRLEHVAREVDVDLAHELNRLSQQGSR